MLKTHRVLKPLGAISLLSIFLFLSSSIFSGEMVTVKDPDGSEDDAPAGVASLFDLTAPDEESLFFKIEL